MKIIYLFIFFIYLNALGQTQKIVYCFPGQGSDHRLFDSLTLDSSFRIQVIEYGTPDKSVDLKTFAKQLSVQIDTSQEFYLVGVSIGGMICAELSEILNPKKTIIISSAKNRSELPFRYKFQKVIPLYKLFPGKIILAGAKLLQPIVEPDRNKNRQTFRNMLGAKNSVYMKRTVKLIINWDRKTNSRKIYHIHGTSDRTLPLKKIKSPDVVVQKGSHMMTLTRAKEISEILNKILKE